MNGSQRRRSKVVEISRGESLQITVPNVALDSQKITVTLEHKSGQHARLRIQAGDEVIIASPEQTAAEPG